MIIRRSSLSVMSRPDCGRKRSGWRASLSLFRLLKASLTIKVPLSSMVQKSKYFAVTLCIALDHHYEEGFFTVQINLTAPTGNKASHKKAHKAQKKEFN